MPGDGGMVGRRIVGGSGILVGPLEGKREYDNALVLVPGEGPGGVLPAVGDFLTVFCGRGRFATGMLVFLTRKFANCLAVFSVRLGFGGL